MPFGAVFMPCASRNPLESGRLGQKEDTWVETGVGAIMCGVEP